MLREVAHVLTRKEILASGSYVPGFKPGGIYHVLLEEGWQQVDMVDGSVILGRVHFQWTAASADAVKQHVCWSPVARGLAVTRGNVVEVEQRGRLAAVVRIKYRNLAEGGCAYRTDTGATIGTTPSDFKPAGDAGAASLHCSGLAEEGWSPARLSHGIEWRKAPATVEPDGASPRSGRSPPMLCQYRSVP